jgi:hypothetical protein
MAIAEDPQGWQSVADDHRRAWTSVFSASREGIDLSARCPVCGNHALHRWYHLDRERPSEDAGSTWRGHGSEWQWCASCRSYEHYSCLVPDWWDAPFEVDLADLCADPGTIEDARLQAPDR